MAKPKKNRRWLSPRDQLKIVQQNCESSDLRSGVIAGTALIEQSLDRKLKSRMRKLSSADDAALFGPGGALGPLSAKIRVAYALGLIGPSIHGELICIAEIRNIFAHTADKITTRHNRLVRKMQRLQAMTAVQNASPVALPKDRVLLRVIAMYGLLLGADRPVKVPSRPAKHTLFHFNTKLTGL